MDAQKVLASVPNIRNLPPDEQREILSILDRIDELDAQEESRVDFTRFVEQMWPAFISGARSLSSRPTYSRHGS